MLSVSHFAALLYTDSSYAECHCAVFHYSGCHLAERMSLCWCVVMLSVIMLIVIMLCVIMLSVILLSVIILSVIILSVNVLSVHMLSVVMKSLIILNAMAPKYQILTEPEAKFTSNDLLIKVP